MRPITQLVGTARAKDRKQRSVSVWIQEPSRRKSVFNGLSSELYALSKNENVPLRDIVLKKNIDVNSRIYTPIRV